MKQTNWQPLGLFSLSLMVVSGFSPVPQQQILPSTDWESKPNLTQGENHFIHHPRNHQGELIVSQASSLRQGNEISLNGRKFAVAWSQWNDGTSTRIGISDIGVMNILGINLLSTNNPQIQPVQWFSGESNQPVQLKAKFINPYRYLDVTEILQASGVQLEITGNALNLTFSPPRITNIRQGNQSWGKRIVLELDRPVFWQVSQAKNEGAVIVEGVTNSQLLAQYKTVSSGSNLNNNQDEDDLGSGSGAGSQSQLFSLESGQLNTKVLLNLPTANGIKVSSLSNPPRLVIDVRPDSQPEREIHWIEGIVWRQKFINLRGSLIPINSLELDVKSPRIALKPITTNSNGLEGIAPIVTTARNTQAAAAINGGFFNRDNQLPLGAIRLDNRWLSGPILNRGAIAWNDQGQVKMGNLRLQETVITATGERLPVLYLNSAYVQGGLARYTSAWGAFYSPLSDNEIIILVENNRVVEQRQGGKAKQISVPIPRNGYLLAIRKNVVSADTLKVGTTVNLDSVTIPADFANYPHILGGGPLLLLNGQIVLNAAGEQFSKAFQQQKASRSAIATTRQGKLIIVAIHNRVGGSGVTLSELAQIMQNLGAVDALNLDGGSSTSIALGGQLIDRSPVTAARVHNGIGIFLSE